MSGESDPKLRIHIDELAIPEILTGKVNEEEEPVEDQEEIRYDNVAVPEVHLTAKKQKGK